jgi:serine/threonine-protein kinase
MLQRAGAGMQCIDIDENVVMDLFGGTLSASRAAEVQAHIDECDACRELVAEVARHPMSPGRMLVVEDVSPAEMEGLGALGDLPIARAAPPPEGSKPPPASLRPGMIVDGRYRLDHLLGEGGVGVVWAATHVATGNAVALKVLKSKEPELTKRFEREARVTAAIAHACIVHIHEAFTTEEGTSVMVMDLLLGESLGRRIQRGPLPLDETRSVLLPAISAVGTAHAVGIVHRDLKPENVFLATTGVKVLDFGLAKIMADATIPTSTKLTRSGFVMGTPYYMAPEQVFADREVDHRVDVWALGVMLYECLAGVRPIHGRSLGAVFRAITSGTIRPLTEAVPEVPRHIGALVGRMMSLDKSGRPDLREAWAALS